MERANRIAWPSAGHLLAAAVPARQVVVDPQRRQRERHQGRDPRPRRAGRAATSGPTSSTMPISMPPEPVTGFCILPRRRDDLEDLGAGCASPSPPCLVAELAEGRGVEVQPFDAHPHLVRPQPGRVEPPGRLRQHAGGLEHPVQSDRRGLSCRHRGSASSWRMPCDAGRRNPPVMRRRGANHRPYISAVSTVTAIADSPAVSPRGRLEQPYALPAPSSSSSRTGAGCPGWRDVTAERVGSRAVAAGALRQERRGSCARVMGDLLEERFYADLERDQARAGDDVDAACRRRWSTRWCRRRVPTAPAFTEAFYADPVRRYMLPVFSDRRTDWPQPPARQPRLAARARHVGRRGADPPLPDQGAGRAAADLPAVLRALHPDGPRRQLHARCRQAASSTSSRSTGSRRCSTTCAAPRVRDVVVSGGDVANMPWPRLESFLDRLLEIDNIRDIRLATKALMGLPQHWLQDDVARAWSGWPPRRASAGVDLAIHTHVNPAQLGDAAGRRGGPGDARRRHPRRPQPGRADARGQRRRRRPARPVLRAAGRREDHCRTTSTCAT